MRFIKSDKPDLAANFIAHKIKTRLEAGQTVAWLLSGGSAITVAVLAARQLDGNNRKLTVSLVDERYGALRHSDSNWAQLEQAGFNVPGAKLEPILTGKSASETAQDYNHLADSLFKHNDYCIGLLGIGVDGHIAGILPGSPAADAKDFACFYIAPDYSRLTLTPKALIQLDEVVVYAVDETKRQALNELDRSLDINEQPAQVLKLIPAVTIYNVVKGEHS